jgi:uncharacterized membrane protein YagU involved in acid resistance
MEEQLRKRNLFTWILFTWLLTATIDILLAFIINYHVPPFIIFRSIASGLFGSAAFGKGAATIYYGLFLHYFIAFTWTIIFFLLFNKLISIVKFKIIQVFLTGLIIWLVMNLVVLPLSRIPPQQFHALNVTENIAALIIAYGLPITLIADKFYHN